MVASRVADESNLANGSMLNRKFMFYQNFGIYRTLTSRGGNARGIGTFDTKYFGIPACDTCALIALIVVISHPIRQVHVLDSR
jgi:hypothetical protein